MKRILVLLYGLFSYGLFLGVFLYAVGFVGGFVVPTALDGASEVPAIRALGVNLLLLGLFALQHSIMARPWFKKWWMRIVPAAIERSTYVLCTNLAMITLFWQWQPMGGVVWDVQSWWGRTALYSLFALGWLIVLVSTFLINHFDLFGLRQVWIYFRGLEYKPLGFVTPGPYKLVRHPMYIGWMTVVWAIPTMSIAHLAFAFGITSYILVAIYFEERDLVRLLGKGYADYRVNVPMLIPNVSRETRRLNQIQGH